MGVDCPPLSPGRPPPVNSPESQWPDVKLLTGSRIPAEILTALAPGRLAGGRSRGVVPGLPG